MPHVPERNVLRPYRDARQHHQHKHAQGDEEPERPTGIPFTARRGSGAVLHALIRATLNQHQVRLA
ncbi:hypothetical protein GCM10018987_43530 [Streptomyces cremeus]